MFTVYLVNIVKEFFLSVFKTSEERLKNPFIGTFILSFIAFNWKPILVIIFSSIPIEDRVSYVSNNYSDISYLLVLPLLLSFFYVLALPKLMCWIDDNTFESFKKRNEHIYSSKAVDIQGQITIAEQELELEDKRANYKDKADLNSQITQLKSVIELLESEKKGLISDAEKSSNTIISLEKSNKNLNEQNIAKDKVINEYDKDKESFDESYSNTPDSIIEDFKSNFESINSLLGTKTERDSLISNFLTLGLIRKSVFPGLNKKFNVEKFIITNKGWHFIKRSFEESM